MRRYLVVTPEYGIVIPVTDEGEGPLEYNADVIEIEADSGRDAVALGVREMLRDPWPLNRNSRYLRYRYCRDQRSDRLCPYTGVKAFPVNRNS